MAEQQGRIISIFGTKGGVGKTIIGVNLAIDIARETGEHVAFVDLNLSLPGDAELLLGLSDAKSIVQLIPMLDGPGGAILRGFLTQHSSGLTVIPSYGQYKEKKMVTAQVVRRFLSLCAQTYNYIVIDIGSHFSEESIAALDCSHSILLLSQTDLLSLHQTVKSLSYLRLHHFPKERIEVILNNAHPKVKLDDRTITSTLRRQPLQIIPAVPDIVTTSIIRREPFVISAPRSIISRRIGDITLACIRKLAQVPDIDFGLFRQVLSADGSVAAGPLDRDGITDDETRKVKIKERDKLINLVKNKVHAGLIDRLDLRKLDVETGNDPEKIKLLREQTFKAIVELLDEVGTAIVLREERQKIAKEILDEALGLGPLEDLIKDPTINEIMVNKYNRIYIERRGKIELTEYSFINNRQLLGVIERIVSPLGRRIDESTPFVDARLLDGSRVNAIIPPVSLYGPMITIRKFSQVPYQINDLIQFGTLTEDMAIFFQAAVRTRQNVLISGGTGSGKTTLLNVISSFIPSEERILTIEDAAELQMSQDHVGALEARPPNIEGEGEVTIRDLVRNALRMRPDRIIVGECRGGETLDMLQAMNTGHDGSLTTIHANSPRDSLSRLETMVLFAGYELPSIAIRNQIASAMNLIIQTARFTIDGSRKTTHVFEITGMKGNDITMEPVFLYIQTGVGAKGHVEGRFIPTGYVPSFIKEYQRRGFKISTDIFQPATQEDRKILSDYMAHQKVIT